ncbi:sensor histidine kinase [Microbacterium sp. NPDC058021]|uniref:sensor histidine kinase n=1 Tax=Microbacterium sp. NPDC058021 TaxID=3346306 RepID=UPI0036DD820B
MFRQLKTYQIVVDVGGAGLFGLLAFYLELELGRDLPYNAVAAALLAVAMAAALAVRRLSPGLALGLAWCGAILQMVFERQPSPTDVAIFAVLYTTAAYGTRRVFWAGFASVIVGAITIATYLFAPSVHPLGRSGITTAVAILIAALFGLGLAWTTGALVRTGIRARENRRAQVAAEADTVAEQERVRIARDMHDVVAHSLAVVIAQADGARYAAAADPAAATAALGTISSTARAALSDVRLLLTQLRHSQGEGPQPTIADLEELYAQVRAAGVDLRVSVDPTPPGEPPAAVQLAVYRILQEALTNALRHGGPGPVHVWLSWRPDHVTLSVANARAATAPAEHSGRGHGLIGMRERAQLAGGWLDAGVDGETFVVRAAIPVGAAVTA